MREGGKGGEKKRERRSNETKEYSAGVEKSKLNQKLFTHDVYMYANKFLIFNKYKYIYILYIII